MPNTCEIALTKGLDGLMQEALSLQESPGCVGTCPADCRRAIKAAGSGQDAVLRGDCNRAVVELLRSDRRLSRAQATSMRGGR